MYNTPTILRRVFKYKDKNIRENFAGFLNCTVIRPNKTLNIKPPVILKAQLIKTSDHVIHLVKEISEENYFLYEDSNMIEATFFQ